MHRSTKSRHDWRAMVGLALAVTLAAAGAAGADGGVTFTNIAADDGAGITFRRVPSSRAQLRQDILDSTPIPVPQFLTTTRPNSPNKARGAPGVAIFDYDGDGDLDI